MEEKRCPRCGAVIPEDAKHCPECGVNLQEALAAAAESVAEAAAVAETAAENAVETAAENTVAAAESVAESAEATVSEAVEEVKTDIAEAVAEAPAPAFIPEEPQPAVDQQPFVAPQPAEPPVERPVGQAYTAPVAPVAPAAPQEDPNLAKEREKELKRLEKEREAAEKEQRRLEKEREAAEKEARKEQARQEAEAKARAKEERKERLANRAPLTEDDVWRTPYQPISPWGWIGYWILLAIPVVGFVLSIIWACGGTKKKTLQNYCIALWIVILVCAILLIAAFVAIWIVTGNPIEWFQKALNEIGNAISSI